MPTLAQVEEQIYVVEGFRVTMTPLNPKVKSLPSYDFQVMAPQRWRISDWKNGRLGAYIALIRDVTLRRGDGTPVKSDLQLGNLRDSYYAAKYGNVAPPAAGEQLAASENSGSNAQNNVPESDAGVMPTDIADARVRKAKNQTPRSR